MDQMCANCVYYKLVDNDWLCLNQESFYYGDSVKEDELCENHKHDKGGNENE